MAQAGSYVVTGYDININKQYSFACAAGSYLIAGSDINILASRKIVALPGGYLITGYDLNFVLPSDHNPNLSASLTLRMSQARLNASSLPHLLTDTEVLPGTPLSLTQLTS